MYFNEGGRAAFLTLWGLSAARVLACPAAKKSPRCAGPEACHRTSPCRGASKGSKKIVWAQLEKEHGGRCAQWRTRLASLCRDALSARSEQDGHKSPLAWRTVTRSQFSCFLPHPGDSQPPGNGSSQHAEQQGTGDRDEPFAPEQAKPEVSRQAAKPELLQPGLQAAEDDQGQQNNDQPAQHALPLCPCPVFTGGVIGRPGQSPEPPSQAMWRTRPL